LWNVPREVTDPVDAAVGELNALAAATLVAVADAHLSTAETDWVSRRARAEADQFEVLRQAATAELDAASYAAEAAARAERDAYEARLARKAATAREEAAAAVAAVGVPDDLLRQASPADQLASSLLDGVAGPVI
jgi:hypothetical protein